MKTKVKLKDDCKIPQPMTQKEWAYGYVDGYVRAANNMAYAVVVTEHGEFEFCSFTQLLVVDEHTIRDYLRMLLEALWREDDCFSGKRPFGNSGWEYDLYVPLIKAGFVEGEIDEDGFLGEFDKQQAYSMVFELIEYVFSE